MVVYLFFNPYNMYVQMTQQDFVNIFSECNREFNFSTAGRRALFNHLEALEEDCDIRIELDVIAICCDYTEFDSLEEVLKEYNLDTLEQLQDNTTVIEVVGGGIIIQSF